MPSVSIKDISSIHPASGSGYFIFKGSAMVNEQILLALMAKFKVYYIFYKYLLFKSLLARLNGSRL